MLVRDWPPGSPRILVSDAWLANAGDAAIAVATQQRLNRLVPGAAVLHAAYQGDLLAEHYPELALVPPLAGLLDVTPAIPELKGWDPAASERVMREADVVLCQGGGYAMEHYDPWERLRAWELVVERQIPIGFGAQTVGPFNGERERSTLATVYGAARVIALRESQSVRHVLEMGARAEQLLVTADEAFSLFTPSPTLSERRGIACVLSRDPQLMANGALADTDRSVDPLARLVAALVRLSDGEGVTMLSTFQGLGGLGRGFEDDSEVAAEVVEALPTEIASQIRTTTGYLTPGRCADVIGSHRMLVTTRMHPAIFAVALGVPTLLLSQAYKATSMFRTVGLVQAIVERLDPASIEARLSRSAALPAPADAATARERAAWNDAVVQRLLASAG